MGKQGAEGVTFPKGLFGPTGAAHSKSPTRLIFSNVDISGANPTANFQTIPEGNEPPGEGDADGGDSCFYQYKDPQGNDIGGEIPCELCDFVIIAKDVPCGGMKQGKMRLDLALDADAQANPDFQSEPITVDVELDDTCTRLLSVNGIEVDVSSQ
jgi:hypothetical protein